MNVIYCIYNINVILIFIFKKILIDMDIKERIIRWGGGGVFKKELVKSMGKVFF